MRIEISTCLHCCRRGSRAWSIDTWRWDQRWRRRCGAGLRWCRAALAWTRLRRGWGRWRACWTRGRKPGRWYTTTSMSYRRRRRCLRPSADTLTDRTELTTWKELLVLALELKLFWTSCYCFDLLFPLLLLLLLLLLIFQLAFSAETDTSVVAAWATVADDDDDDDDETP